MNARQVPQYRLKMAEGFLNEARQDLTLGRWRSAVDNSQLTVENAAKAVLALLGPVGKTHNPAPLLRSSMEQRLFPPAQSTHIQRVIELAESLGPDVHIQTDYGDEQGGRTPWELFGESDARRALDAAKEIVSLARQIVEELIGGGA